MAFFRVLLFAMAALAAQSVALDVEKAFTENEVVPDVLTVAPKKVLKVSFNFTFNELELTFQKRHVYILPQFHRFHIQVVLELIWAKN